MAGFERFRIFLEPLLRERGVAVCEWNAEAESIAEMTPSLPEAVATEEDWRAIIVCGGGRRRKNPFDYTGYHERCGEKPPQTWEEIAARREKRFACYENAVHNPLWKLASALCGTGAFQPSLEEGKFDAVAMGETHTGELMLSKFLETADAAEAVRLLSGADGEKLPAFLKEAEPSALARMMKRRDAKGIFGLLGQEHLLRFLRMFGNADPRVTDPEYTEYILENTKKNRVIASVAPDFDYRGVLPSEVLCVALRTYDGNGAEPKINWGSFTENDYSRFSEFNLYPDKLKFMAFDVRDDAHNKFDYDLLRFLGFVLILANNEIPAGAMSKNRLYLARCENDNDALSALLTAYDTKLQKTAIHLTELREEALLSDQKPYGDASFMKKAESPVVIPLLTDKTVEVNALKLSYRQIGLSRDCPLDENAFLSEQYAELKKNFRRYLKQPRRALAGAVEELRRQHTVTDKELHYLSAFQLDDVTERINGAEQRIAAAQTSNIYDTEKYDETMEREKHALQKYIAERMTKRTAIAAGAAALLAYFLGFVPLLITSANTAGSFVFSVLFTAAACGLLALCGLGGLFWLRRGLIARFKKFNEAMAAMVSELTNSIHGFSKYLTHVCAFMRGYSVLNQMNELDKPGAADGKLYHKHMQDIQKTREQFKILFSDIALPSDTDFSHINIYDFDFLQAVDYTYDVPFEEVRNNKIEFMREGNFVKSPVSFVKAITLKREELYDV
ncbi:MAG: hypothetical protein LBH54_00780 [Clostridiales bacterium]|nr:hypothetical protein [Clostridiales bacterium]